MTSIQNKLILKTYNLYFHYLIYDIACEECDQKCI